MIFLPVSRKQMQPECVQTYGVGLCFKRFKGLPDVD